MSWLWNEKRATYTALPTSSPVLNGGTTSTVPTHPSHSHSTSISSITSSLPLPSSLTSRPTRRSRRAIYTVVGGVVTIAILSLIAINFSASSGNRLVSGPWSWGSSGPGFKSSVIEDGHAGDSINEGKGGGMWGWTETMGWVQDKKVGLADLGELAEHRYRLAIEPGLEGTKQYFQRLYEFTISLPPPLHNPLSSSLWTHLPPKHTDIIPRPPKLYRQPTAMISYKNIHQTDKTMDSIGEETREWEALNLADGWTLNFLDDEGAQEWVDETFGESPVTWAWHWMSRGVLKADFLRYLLPLVQGGVYSDVDTRPVRRIEEWGHKNVEYLNISETDGENWRDSLSTSPAVIVAIDVDVHQHPTWYDGWPRPLGICQWTLSSAPYHPIMLDAVRRVVNGTEVVRDWELWREEEIKRLESEGLNNEANELRNQGRDHAMSVMEWTGPGLFTDSVMAFLLARYNVTWHRLRGLNHPLRIGDVLVLPITAFSPGGEPDFGADQPGTPQNDVLHDFRGSWKGEGWRR